MLPRAQAVQLSFDQIVALQSADEPEAPPPRTVEDTFLEEARKTPMERLREQILEALGYTEDSLAQLPPDERAAVEDKIRKLIQEKFREAMGVDKNATANATDSAAAELSALL